MSDKRNKFVELLYGCVKNLKNHKVCNNHEFLIYHHGNEAMDKYCELLNHIHQNSTF